MATLANTRFHALQTKYSLALGRFAASGRGFDVVHSVTADSRARPSPDVLFILDSSFNPPTVAHLHIASAALVERPQASTRLLLLLATQNADKPANLARFEDRLAMMELFATDVLAYLRNQRMFAGAAQLPQIDIGTTKKPYFVDKAAEIDAAHDVYPRPLQQVHLTGYDTLVRIFDPKYYPPEHTLHKLDPFLSRHRLRVTLRPDSDWGSVDDQRAFLQQLAQAAPDERGTKREWARHIDFVDALEPGDKSISSTRARQAVAAHSPDLDWLVPRGVHDYISSQEPYK